MENKDLVRVFAERTLKNLQKIEKLQKQRAHVYEVTQLINSMLGIIIFPRERDLNKIPNKSFDQLKNEGWPIIKVTKPFKQIRSLSDFTHKLRNSIAHCNIEFINANQEIIGIKLWNMKKVRENSNTLSDSNCRRINKKVWEAELSIQELRDITLRFIQLFLNL